MKKYLLLAGLVLALPACDLLGNECGRNNPATYYDVQGLAVGLTRQSSNGSPANLAPNATVTSPELRLRLQLTERYYTTGPAHGFLSAAYACSLADPGSRGTAERVDSLSITSAFAYDAAHPAGTSLADLLEANSIEPFRLPSRQSPQEPFRNLEFRFRTPPAAAGPQQFRVYYRQTNGEVYQGETVSFQLLP